MTKWGHYTYGRYIASSDFCQFLIEAIEIAAMEDDDLQQKIVYESEVQEKEEIKVSSDGVELIVSPLSKSKRYSLQEINQVLAKCIQSFLRMESERTRQEALERAAQFRKNACYLTAVIGNTSQSKLQSPVKPSAVPSIFYNKNFPQLGSTDAVSSQVGLKR